MTANKLNKANDLAEQIKETQNRLNAIEENHRGVPVDVRFDYKNGYGILCSDAEIIEEVRLLMLERTKSKLGKLQEEFNEL